MLILGGLHLRSRRYRRRPDHRRRREAQRILLGPAARRRYRGLVRLCHRACLPAVPAAGIVRRADHRAGLSDVLSRGRPVQDQLCQRSGGVPDPAGSHRHRRHPAHRLCRHAADPQRLPDQRDHDAVPDLHAGGDRAQYPDRLYRAVVARHRRVHGRRRLCLLQAHHLFPEREHRRLDHRVGLCLGRCRRDLRLPSVRIKGFYLAIATLAAQFFLEWCFTRIPWLYNYNVSAAIEVPQRDLFGIIVTGPRATATRAISSCSRS